MQKLFFIVMGRSGSGKGTQALLLATYLKSKGYASVKHMTTGGGFRDFVERDIYTAKKVKEINNAGGLSPEFLAVWNWSNLFIEQVQENDSIILDGAPRREVEVSALHSAIRFFDFAVPIVIYIDVSEGWAMEKLTSRGRDDDNEKEKQIQKMKWFEEDVLPCIDLYSHDKRYTFIHINGEHEVDEVHNAIVSSLEKSIVQ